MARSIGGGDGGPDVLARGTETVGDGLISYISTGIDTKHEGPIKPVAEPVPTSGSFANNTMVIEASETGQSNFVIYQLWWDSTDEVYKFQTENWSGTEIDMHWAVLGF